MLKVLGLRVLSDSQVPKARKALKDQPVIKAFKALHLLGWQVVQVLLE